ncbi:MULTISPECIES: ArsR/SmtB family transcription factor [Cohnella]|uniref:ArsR/SmtB family transcription factor n=1 Tax=Cohnella TaxID=329857 RepID=UPI0009B95621|nr:MULTISPECIES: helix-turn-helix transcriptional regulator [Cohnella]MBN2984108.1 helix-turn-helix transcriptional regulator [Cohnella algarum]
MKILFHPKREDIQLTAVLAALSDPNRMRLVTDVAECGERPCGSFDQPVAKSTMSHHVRILREAGVLNIRVQGTQHFLSLRTDDLEARFPGVLTSILKASSAAKESLPG